MRSILISFASITAALSLFSVGALAATTSEESSDTGALPAACTVTGTPATPSTTATGTVTTTATTTTTTTTTPTVTMTATPVTTGDAVSDDSEDTAGHAIQACIAAQHEDGDHGIGQTVSELAHELNAERHADREDENGRNKDDDASATVATIGTSTPTTGTVVVAATSTPITTTASITPSVGPVLTGQSKHGSPSAQHGHGHGGEDGHGSQQGGD